MDYEVTNRELLNDIENFSNFRFLGIGKLSDKQKKERETKEERKADKKDAKFIKSLTKQTLETGKVIAEPKTETESVTELGTELEPEKKFLWMKRSVGIPVAIVGGLIIIGGVIFAIIKLRK